MNKPKTGLCAALLVAYCASPMAQTAAPQLPPRPDANPAPLMQRLQSHPENWKLVASADTVKLFVELGSIKKVGQYTKAWTLLSLTSPELIEDSKWTQSSRNLEYVDCLRDSRASKQALNYDDDIGYGNVVSTFNWEDSELKFREPSPGSIGSAIVREVCRIASSTKKK